MRLKSQWNLCEAQTFSIFFVLGGLTVLTSPRQCKGVHQKFDTQTMLQTYTFLPIFSEYLADV